MASPIRPIPIRADGAVAQSRAAERKVARGPFAGADITLGLRQFSYGAEQETDGGIGDLFGQHIGCMGHDDAALRCGVRIDMIVADAETCNDLKVWQAREQGIVDRLHRRRHRHRAHIGDIV